MSPSPPTYTSLSNKSSHTPSLSQILFLAIIIAPYALILLCTSETTPLFKLLPLLFFFSILHLYTHPYVISRLFPSVDPESAAGQKKWWIAGNVQIACLLAAAGGLVGARLEGTSSDGLVGVFFAFIVSGGVALGHGTEVSDAMLCMSVFPGLSV